MNSHIPFDANNDWTLDPYHCNQSNDPLVDKVIGNAYAVVRAVYCNLGNLKLLYDFLNTYGMVIGVKSEADLKKLNKLVKYARIYGYSSTNDRQVTDYLYVPDDTSGIRPDDPTATGSWIKVATSATGGGGGEGTGQGSYIPYVYANGSALGGETSFKVPEGTVGVPFLIINGSVQYIGYGFTYSPATATVTLSNPLSQGDEVVALTTAVPANPDNPEVPGWIQVNWLYNNGSAVGGEQVITIPYNFQDVPAVYKNGLRLYKGLQSNSYIIDPGTHTITMTEILAQGDRVIVTLGGESETLTVTDRTLQEVARSNNVQDSDVVLSTTTHLVITGKKIIYDVSAQKYWRLPVLPPNAYIVKVEGDKLTYNPGGVVTTLLEADTSQNAIESALVHTALEIGLPMAGTFEGGAQVTSAAQSVGYKAEGKLYRWAGTLPKTVAKGSTPESSGGIDEDAWVSVDSTTLRGQLASKAGSTMVNHQGHTLSELLPVFTSTYGINGSNSAATNATNLVAMIADVLSKDIKDIYVDMDATIDDVSVPVRDKTKVFFHSAGGMLTGLYRRETMVENLPDNNRISNGLCKTGMECFYNAKKPTVVVMGDSISTEGPNALAKADSMYSMIVHEIQKQNPTLAINAINRAIGGQTWLNANTKPTGFPAWYTDQSKDWLEYIKQDAPDLLILAFGMNDANGFNAGAIHAVVDKIKAWPKVPSLLFVTNPVPAISTRWSNGVGFYETIFQEGRDWAAGYARSYAKYYGYSILDINRQFCLLRDGRDYYGIPLKYHKKYNQSYVFDTNVITRDFSLQGEIASWPTNKVLSVKVGSGSLDTLYLSNSGGNYKVDAFCSGSQQPYISVTTSVPVTAGQRLEITVQSDFITVFAGITQVIGFNCIRTGGELALVAEWQDASKTGPFAYVEAYVGNWLQCKYTATDEDIWGTDDGTAATQLPGGGNGINHYSSRGLSLVVAPVVEAFDFRVHQNKFSESINTLGTGVTASGVVSANKDGNTVTLSGNLKVTGSLPTKLFTLPVGYRPTASRIISAACVGTNSWELAVVSIDADGTVSLQYGTASNLLPLDSVSFII